MEPVILCAIEATTAEAVVLTAGELAPALGARVLLLHVENDPAFFNSGDQHGAPTRGEHLVRRVGGLLPYGMRVEERLALGAPAGEIVSVAEDVGASLIIVGSRRRGPLVHAPARNVSENVVRRASCPVVIAPVVVRDRRRESGSGNHRSVLVGVGSTERTLAVAQLGRELAAIFGDRLVLVHAHDHPRQDAPVREPGDAPPALPSVVRDAHESAGASAALVLAGGPAAYVLDRASDSEEARLIVIGAGDKARGAASSESLAVQLSGIALCPIVVLPDDAPVTGLQPADPDQLAMAGGRSR